MEHPVPEENEAHLQRPDWLVGSDEAAAADRASAREATPAVRLVRPVPEEPSSSDFGALDLAGSAPESAGAGGTPAATGAGRVPPAQEPKAAEPKAWTAAASSVPRLRLVKSPPASMPMSAGPEKFAPPALPGVDGEVEESFLDDASSPAPPPARGDGNAVAGAAPARPALALRESWMVVAVDAARNDRRIQLGLCVLIAAVIAIVLLRPKDDARIPLSAIHKDPHRFDGQIVTVQGKVGEVFPVGGGYAFYLHQGRDTLVVFTRSRRPESREKVTVKGSISTGYLDGNPRQALFEAI